MFCNNCGGNLIEGSNFCRFCGNTVHSEKGNSKQNSSAHEQKIKTSRKTPLKWGLISLAAVAIIAAVMIFKPFQPTDPILALDFSHLKSGRITFSSTTAEDEGYTMNCTFALSKDSLSSAFDATAISSYGSIRTVVFNNEIAIHYGGENYYYTILDNTNSISSVLLSDDEMGDFYNCFIKFLREIAINKAFRAKMITSANNTNTNGIIVQTITIDNFNDKFTDYLISNNYNKNEFDGSADNFFDDMMGDDTWWQNNEPLKLEFSIGKDKNIADLKLYGGVNSRLMLTVKFENLNKQKIDDNELKNIIEKSKLQNN